MKKLIIIYSQTSTLRASILRGPLLYEDFFFRNLVPPTISYVWAIVHAALVLEICRNIETTSRYNEFTGDWVLVDIM